ncbi:MAG: dienelactone hydrolase family protein [Thermodesulfobacteriota bacterium]
MKINPRTPPRRRWVGIALALMTAAGGLALGAACVPLPSPTAAPSHILSDLKWHKLGRPEGPGPFPAMIVLHGCGGIGRREPEWAERLRGWGYVTLILDSLGPRGYRDVCQQANVTRADRIADAQAAAAYLRRLDFVQPDRIGVIGFSHGGWTTLGIVQSRSNPPLFQAAVAFYPRCDPEKDANVGLPLLILIGGRDDWTPASRCRDLMPRLIRPGTTELVVYPEAYHDFDFAHETRDYLNHHLAYDPAAAADAIERTRVFLERHLKKY